jgi:hypothetical protein
MFLVPISSTVYTNLSNKPLAATERDSRVSQLSRADIVERSCWLVYPSGQHLHTYALRHEGLQAYTKSKLWSLCGHQDNQLPDLWVGPWVTIFHYRHAPAGVTFWKH